ncbi:glycosyl transferase family 1 [Roseimicrobium gellanilyticum]|uniref:Glycosyl transferase family 1 n=1 Tax=Roseimicrobium gellanilyticum TaxID=748857 RepID=A0A366HS72_9BACT|nr:glycosyltransferase family 4 protein [Roseimicrobium gellanilyticum]RBP46109.1 glycosyl transferase family 1 [Roseimicrobium gellanilyticum]
MDQATNSSSNSLPEAVRQLRREVLWTASREKQVTSYVDLQSSAFDHEVRGFHLLETLPDGRRIRWMSTRADFLLKVGAPSLNIEVRSGVVQNVLTVLVQGNEVKALQLTFEWQSAEIDLRPYLGREVRVELRTSGVLAAPGDSRELSAQVARLSTGSGAKVAAADDDDGMPKQRSPHQGAGWCHPPLAELPPFSHDVSPQIGAASYSVAPSSVLLAVKFFRPFDPTSEEMLSMARLLRQSGFRVHLAAEEVHESFLQHISSLDDLTAQVREENGILILHHGTSWDYGKRLMQHSRARCKMLRYHNVSKSETFLKYPAGYLEPTIAGRFETTDLIPHATHLTAPAFSALGDLLACGAPPEKLLHLPFLHDLEKLDELQLGPVPVELLRSSASLKILVLGRQLPSKGLHHCLAALAHYRRAYGDGISMHFVGARNALHERYIQELELLVDEHALAGMVTFTSEVNRTQVASWLRHCDALLTMSESEAACIPIFEAGWFGKPILGYQCGGKTEHAGPGQLLFESLDPALHAAAWHRLVQEPELRITLGALAWQHVREHFGTAKIHARFMEVIRLISAGRS